MKHLLTLILFLSCSVLDLYTQVSRYPYIQSTSQHSVIVAWRTSNAVQGEVRYGIDSNNLNLNVSESNANTEHGILLENLVQNTKYYYAIYSGNVLEAEEFFYTAKDTSESNFSFIQYGDCGYNSALQRQVGALMEADSAEFAVVCGDIDQGGVPHVSESGGGDDYDEIYFDVYNDGVDAKMLSRECHYTSIGNHDYYANNGAEYDNSFYLPHNNNENSERYYSFTWGDAKFIALDVITPFDNTTFPFNFAPIDDRWWTDFRPGSPQYQFLENELKCNDKKWVFIYFHEGPWTNYWGPDYLLPSNLGGDYYQFDGNVMVRDHLVPLFEQYNVDFVLNGHSHLYERGEKNGVTYVTAGSAGDSNPGTNIQYANHPELLVGLLQNAYARFSVYSDSVFLQCINKDNAVIDTYTKTKAYTDFMVSDSIKHVSCYQANDGEVYINVVGPKAPYTIEWFDNGSSSFSRNNLSAGTYYAYIRNKYLCERVISVSIEEPAEIVPEIISLDGQNSFCTGDSISLKTDSLYASYLWSTADTSAQITLFDNNMVNVQVVSVEGCIGMSSDFYVNTIANPIAAFDFAKSGLNYNFLAQNTNSINMYTWHFGDGSSDTSLASPLVNHIFPSDGIYTVELFVSNTCTTDTTQQSIIVGNPNHISELQNVEKLRVYPNPIVFETTIDASEFEVEKTIMIFNENGKELAKFKTNKASFKLKKNGLSSGVYYLILKTKTKNGFAKLLIN